MNTQNDVREALAERIASDVLDHCYGAHAVNDRMVELAAEVVSRALASQATPSPAPQSDEVREPYCLWCDKAGHVTTECWSTHGINTPQAKELSRLTYLAAQPPSPERGEAVHELKTDPEVFDAVAAWLKTHEIRYNDRNFQVGDRLRLRRTKYTGAQMRMRPEACPLEYTGEECTRVVSHVLSGYGLQDGWVILSFALAAPESAPESAPEKAEATELVEIYRDEKQNPDGSVGNVVYARPAHPEKPEAASPVGVAEDAFGFEQWWAAQSKDRTCDEHEKAWARLGWNSARLAPTEPTQAPPAPQSAKQSWDGEIRNQQVRTEVLRKGPRG